MNDGFCEYVLAGIAGLPSAELCPEPAAPDSDQCAYHSDAKVDIGGF